MKTHTSKQRNHALTITEVLVTVAAVCLLALVALAQTNDSQVKSQIRNCVQNLMQIGLAFREWEGDNGDKFPMQVSVKKGGAMELITDGNVAACFQVMSNALFTPKILICPADTNRFAATDFTSDFDNSHVSYFVGVIASQEDPERILSGDDNLAIDKVPVKSGLMLLATNAPVNWTAARHMNQGNIGLADGSVQQVSLPGLRRALQKTGLAINRIAIP